jgi:predicted metal-dependent peptidase
MLPQHKQRNDKVKVSIAKYHRIFNALLTFSEPIITDTIATAAVVCKIADNKPIKFLFNPTFFDALDQEQLEFVYCHEMIHIIGNHAMRGKGLDKNILGVATDIAVNEYLFSHYPFNRANILKIDDTGLGNTCTYDKYFDDKVLVDQNFEYYYNLLLKSATEININTLDNHDNLEETGKNLSDVLNKALNQLNIPELQSLQKMVGDVAGKDSSDDLGRYIEKRKAKVTTLEHTFRSTIKDIKEFYEYDWRRKDLKMVNFSSSLKIPYDARQEKTIKNKKLLYAFVDTSASCDDLINRFMNLIDGVDTKDFDVKLYGFNTEVYEIVNRKIFSGGTSFHPIEEFLLSLKKYPDNVFMITDGAGTSFAPKFPERFMVYLTEDNKGCFLNKEKIKFKLI